MLRARSFPAVPMADRMRLVGRFLNELIETRSIRRGMGIVGAGGLGA
jgi:hypothetical protein